MKRIGWENLPSKKTPISAENLELMETNIEEAIEDKAYIKAYRDTKQSISHGTFQMYFENRKMVGDYFEIDSVDTTKVKVLKDCIALISANVFIENSAGDSYIYSRIKTNGTVISGNLTEILNKDFICNSISTVVQELKKGDYIQVEIEYASDSGTPAIREGQGISNLNIIKL